MFTKLNYYHNQFYRFVNLFEKELDVLTKRTFNEENLSGESCTHYTINQYYMAFHYVAMLHYILINSPDKSWDTIKDYYKVENTIEKFKCAKINIDAIFELFDLYTEFSCGINGFSIEESFEVEPDSEICGVTVSTDNTGISSLGIEVTFEIEPDSIINITPIENNSNITVGYVCEFENC